MEHTLARGYASPAAALVSSSATSASPLRASAIRAIHISLIASPRSGRAVGSARIFPTAASRPENPGLGKHEHILADGAGLSRGQVRNKSPASACHHVEGPSMSLGRALARPHAEVYAWARSDPEALSRRHADLPGSARSRHRTRHRRRCLHAPAMGDVVEVDGRPGIV